MTNNPTIDGVSRELLQKVDDLLYIMTGHDSHPKMIRKYGEEFWKPLEAMRAEICTTLAAPVVERQPVDDEQWWADTPDGDSALVTRVGALTEWQRGRDGMRDERDAAQAAVAAMQSTIAQLEDKLTKALNLDFQRRQEIERLQARVQELESGRGEPVAWLAEAVGPDGTAYRRTSSTTQITMRDAKYAWGEGVVSKYEIKIQPLFTAPPAPVAVVLPERKPVAATCVTRDRREGWNACLDATAALNTINVGELDPAQRLALARSEDHEV